METNIKILSREELLKEYSKIIDDTENYPKIHGVDKRVITAQLLHNERVGYLEEISNTGDVAKYEPVLIPVIRRAFPQLIAYDIFGVQPMKTPSSLVFAIKAAYHMDSVNPQKAASSVVLVLADATNFTAGTDIVQGGTSTGTGNGVVRYKEGNQIFVETESGTWVGGAGEQVDDADPYVAAVTTIATVYNNDAFFKFLWKDYDSFATVADAEAATTGMREMGFVIESDTVAATDHKLKAKYTEELAQDLKAVHGLSADAEVAKILSQEIMMEQNRNFIDALNTKAALGGSYAYTYTGGEGRWEEEYAKALYMELNKYGNQIAKTTLRGPANFIVTSLDVASKLESLSIFKSASELGIGPVNLGANVFVGTLGGKYRMYVDIYAASDYVTLGYKGMNEYDAGIYYCPYIPLTVRRATGEEDGQPRVFFGTRYGLGYNPFGAEQYYRQVNVTL